MLAAYGIPQAPMRYVTSGDATVRAFRELADLSPAGSVAVKAYGPELPHKSDVGGVLLDIADPNAAYAAYAELRAPPRPAAGSAPSSSRGGARVELIVGIDQDEVLGPLLLFGLGGTAVDLFGDHGARLTLLTDLDADDLLGESRAAKLLYGHRGEPPCDTDAVADLLHRVSRLADDLPADRRTRPRPGDRHPGRRHRRGRPHPCRRCGTRADPYVPRVRQAVVRPWLGCLFLRPGHARRRSCGWRSRGRRSSG
ncbi:acetate--CoA ligase family protein [Yinghuangia aomiensis]